MILNHFGKAARNGERFQMHGLLNGTLPALTELHLGSKSGRLVNVVSNGMFNAALQLSHTLTHLDLSGSYYFWFDQWDHLGPLVLHKLTHLVGLASHCLSLASFSDIPLEQNSQQVLQFGPDPLFLADPKPDLTRSILADPLPDPYPIKDSMDQSHIRISLQKGVCSLICKRKSVRHK